MRAAVVALFYVTLIWQWSSFYNYIDCVMLMPFFYCLLQSTEKRWCNTRNWKIAIKTFFLFSFCSASQAEIENEKKEVELTWNLRRNINTNTHRAKEHCIIIHLSLCIIIIFFANVFLHDKIAYDDNKFTTKCMGVYSFCFITHFLSFFQEK